MRVILVAAVLLGSSTARADSVVEIGGAIAFPTADNNWTNTAEPSPELSLRAGGGSETMAGLASISWVPQRLDAQPIAGFTDLSMHRFRILGNLELRHRIAPKVTLQGRVGAGVDILRGAYSVTIFGSTSSHSNTDLGFGLDLAGGAYFDVGASTQVGFELGVPIGYHSKKSQNTGDISFDYTQVDIELWLVVRLAE